MPADMNEYFKRKKPEEKEGNEIIFPELEEKDFKLCETVDDVINSKAFKLVVYNILNSQLSHKEATKYYKNITQILAEKGNLDDSNNILELLDYKSFEIKGDNFIRNNIVIPKTTKNHNLKSSDIIALLQNKSIINKIDHYFNGIDEESLVELYENIKESSDLYEELIDSEEYYIIRSGYETYLIDKKIRTVTNYSSEKIDGPYYLLSGENNNYCIVDITKNQIFKFNSLEIPIIDIKRILPVETTIIVNTGNKITLINENYKVKGSFEFDDYKIFKELRNGGFSIKKDGLYSFIDLDGKELVSGVGGEIYLKNNNLYEKRKYFFDKQLEPDYS